MAKNSRQKVPKSDFQSQFSMSKIIRIFLKKNFVEKYQFRGTFFVSTDFVYHQNWTTFVPKFLKNLAFLTAIFGHLTSLRKKSNPFLWSVQSYLQSEMFFYQIPLTWWKTYKRPINQFKPVSELTVLSNINNVILFKLPPYSGNCNQISANYWSPNQF